MAKIEWIMGKVLSIINLIGKDLFIDWELVKMHVLKIFITGDICSFGFASLTDEPWDWAKHLSKTCNWKLFRIKLLSRIYTGDFFACDFLIKMDLAKLHLLNGGFVHDNWELTDENNCLKLVSYQYCYNWKLWNRIGAAIKIAVRSVPILLWKGLEYHYRNRNNLRQSFSAVR